MLGTVKWFNEQKGYGFIKPEQGNKDIFVHVSALNKARIDHLVDGQRIEYELEMGKNGRESAVSLRLV